MPYGYMGKIIRVNLTKGTIGIEEPGELFYRTYIGGKGFIAHYLLNEVPADVDPLGEDNKLFFMTGIMTGIPAAGMPRFVVGAKSPLTGGFGQSEAGGFWGPELKKAGYDGLIIEGRSAKPVYIYVKDENIELKSAEHLWGMETGDCQETIREENGDNNIRVAQIGPGGERLIKYACIISELKHANGRNGLGTVMGSKNLKAIAVRGSNSIPYANEAKIKEIGKKFLDMYMQHPLSRGLYEYGTSSTVKNMNAAGILPTRNFMFGEFEGAEKISGDALNETMLKERKGCYACAIRCKRVVEVKDENITVDPKYGGPEYETLAVFGSLCQVDDLKIIAKANELCNRYSIDTMSMGNAIVFAMECVNLGILNKDDFDGLDVSFGNKDIILPMIEKIAKREGIGDILAEGTVIAAKRIGKGSEKVLLTIKNQELGMHDPRGKAGVGMGYAISETGAEHMLAAHDTAFTQKGIAFDALQPFGILEPLDSHDLSPKKVRMFMYLQYWWSFFNMAGLCYFGPAPRGSMPVNDIIELLKAATGWEVSLWEVMKAGERSINMSRAYNIRAGFTKDDDMLPEKFFEPLQNGIQKGTSIDKSEFERAISTYYSMMGWDSEGIPTEGKLLELNLDWIKL